MWYGSIAAPGRVSGVSPKGFRNEAQVPVPAWSLNNYDLEQINYPLSVSFSSSIK